MAGSAAPGHGTWLGDLRASVLSVKRAGLWASSSTCGGSRGAGRCLRVGSWGAAIGPCRVGALPPPRGKRLPTQYDPHEGRQSQSSNTFIPISDADGPDRLQRKMLGKKRGRGTEASILDTPTPLPTPASASRPEEARAGHSRGLPRLGHLPAESEVRAGKPGPAKLFWRRQQTERGCNR